PFSPFFVALEARLWRDEKVEMRGGHGHRRLCLSPPLTLTLSPRAGRGDAPALRFACSHDIEQLAQVGETLRLGFVATLVDVAARGKDRALEAELVCFAQPRCHVGGGAYR